MRLISTCILTGILLLNGCASNVYYTRIKKVRALVQKKKFTEAETQLKNIIRNHPEKPEPFYLYGLVNYSTGNYYECIMNFDQAERYGLKETNDLYLKKGIALYHTGNREESEKVLSRALEHKPSAGVHKYLGIVRYELGDYTGAIEPLQKATASFSNDLRCHFYLGMALYIEGRNAESLTFFRKALEIDPENPEIIFQTANLHMLDGQYREAVELYTEISPESPYGEDSIYNSAEAYIKLREFSSAVQLLGYLSEKKPGDYNVDYNLSAALIKSGDYLTAAEILREMHDFNRDDARISYNLGLAYQGLGQHSLSLQFLRDAVAQDPKNPIYHYAYGFGLSEDGRDEEAARYMETVLELDPGHVNAGNWLENYRIQTDQSEE